MRKHPPAVIYSTRKTPEGYTPAPPAITFTPAEQAIRDRIDAGLKCRRVERVEEI